MSNVIYKITISNNSGRNQNYVIFNETPRINNQVSANIWANIFQKKMIPNGGTAEFKIAKSFGAVCGYADSNLGTGVSVSVGTPKAVTLGVGNVNGTMASYGTTLFVEIQDGTPVFSSVPQTDGGLSNAFEIRTGDIDYGDAVNNNWLIGLGGATKGTGLSGPAAVFTPEGQKSYQIEPITKYWISTQDYQEGSMIKVSAVAAKSVAIDFSQQIAREASIVHTTNGTLSRAT